MQARLEPDRWRYWSVVAEWLRHWPIAYCLVKWPQQIRHQRTTSTGVYLVTRRRVYCVAMAVRKDSICWGRTCPFLATMHCQYAISHGTSGTNLPKGMQSTRDCQILEEWLWQHVIHSGTTKHYTYHGKTTVSVLHDAQLLLNKHQQIWGGICIHWHFLSSTDMVVLPLSLTLTVTQPILGYYLTVLVTLVFVQVMSLPIPFQAIRWQTDSQ